MPKPTVQQRIETAVAQIDRNYQWLKDKEWQSDPLSYQRRRDAELHDIFEKPPQEIGHAEPVAVAAIECGLIQTREEYREHIPPPLQRSSPSVVIAALRKNLLPDWLEDWGGERDNADWMRGWGSMMGLMDALGMFGLGLPEEVRQNEKVVAAFIQHCCRGDVCQYQYARLQLPETSLRHDEDVVRSLLDVGAYERSDWVALPDSVRSNENIILAAIHTRAAKSWSRQGATVRRLCGWALRLVPASAQSPLIPHRPRILVRDRYGGSQVYGFLGGAAWFFQLPEETRKQEGVVLAALDRGLLNWGHPEHVPQSLKRTSVNILAAVIGRSPASPINTREQWDRDVPPALKVDPRVVASGIRAGLLREWDNETDFPEEVRGVEDVVAAAIGNGVLKTRAQWNRLPEKIRHSQSLRRRAVVAHPARSNCASHPIQLLQLLQSTRTARSRIVRLIAEDGVDWLFHSGQALPKNSDDWSDEELEAFLHGMRSVAELVTERFASFSTRNKRPAGGHGDSEDGLEGPQGARNDPASRPRRGVLARLASAPVAD
eukprot:g8642.t1